MRNKLLLKDYIKLLKENGFKVISSLDNPEYIFFEKNKNIGYCEINRFFGLDFNTVHKPCREHGTGFNIYKHITEPNITHALNTFILAPQWAINTNRIIKYKSLEELIKESNLKYIYL